MDARFEDPVGRRDPRVAQVALDPASTPIIDLNAATFQAGGSPNRISLADLLHNDGGPPRFISPFIPGRSTRVDQSTLPLMVYLPGIDGTGLAASRQFPFLVDAFDLHALSIPGADRTPFEGLISLIEEYMDLVVSQSPPERPVYLLGESFGGVLALAVAEARPDLVDRVVLVNPATSFSRSLWPALGPFLPRVPKELYGSVPVALAPILGNPILLAAFGVDTSAPLQDQAVAFGQGVVSLIPQLQALTEILPPPTLQWKLKLLEEGNRQLAPKLKDVNQRVLLLVGSGDLLLPSGEEGPRLEKLLPRCRLKVMQGRSHALLQEAGINLVSILKEEGFYVEQRNMSAPTCFMYPKSSEESYTTTIRRLTSPVFFSTTSDGIVQRGLGNLPDARPVLFVGNHQTFALDLGLMVEQIVRERGILPRGLAHPAIFAEDAKEDSGSFRNFMTTFGAVPVGGRNFFKLLQNKEAVLLFPGGVREAYKGKGEEYKLFWPERPEFVRMAARYGATIVPFAGVGAEDAVTMLLEPAEIRNLPFIGGMIEQRARNSIPQARRGVSEDKELEDLFIAPFAVPKAPQRFYYLFGKPIETSRADLDDPARVGHLYRQVKGEVESGISFLLRNRQRDPYNHFLPRALYEAASGGKQAPTFPLP
ncbi:alpha/beta-hydrolase [Coccomyxa subellipsoidea C-169]|uniref:Alpha/beta-hydrolase n=1 Tax=Coccomyxa subellipsoidea (strain C-169) TaxID=574566 RepID=I0Z307_COCSC|nr:alpha/beta-hydrolase [Coccomyxa subellipsoidea C-169]EIE25026.1 alpha/beta-hydrolase [Coccomyxa subellipsoidea C-169]|eukprot:XP_005649570.1 alpha/beta-hydrolase [Coccomyxa subellipsoidea C-169]